MKFILYLTLFTFLHTISSEKLSEDCNILELDDSESYSTDTGSDGSPAFKFIESKPITTPVEKLYLNENTLATPFILYTIFKLEEPSCLFTIIDKSVTKLGLCFTLAAINTTRITFEGEGIPNKHVDFSYENKFSDWTTMLIHVQEKSVSLYINCSDTDATNYTENVKDIYFSNDAVLNLGHYENGNRFLKGYVQEIKILPNADDEKLKLINYCSDTESGDSEETDSGDTGEDSTPENLTLFTEKDPVKGEKGDKGDRGESLVGPPGPEGPQGPQGPAGRKGEEGTCSCSKSVVSSLLKSMPEMKGPQGENGPKGETGDPGATGLTGKQGNQGERGPQGLKGETGERGDDGPPGRDGAPGSKGEQGKTGDPGPQGPQGPRGPAGPPGPACKETDGAKEVPMPGEKGDMGPVGPTGPKGDLGEKGEKGKQGDKGEKGDRGHHGSQGLRGEKGDRGEAGMDGTPGESGTHGRPADKGDKGDMGDKGEPGLAGLPATLYSLLDPEMDPEENAAIVEKLRGHKGEIGKSGEKGDKGDVGPQGQPGAPGKDGRNGSHGGRGPQGEIGPRGLKGEPGEPGNFPPSNTTVTKGPKGERGDRGPPGKPGPRGPHGQVGKRGPAGPSGPKGPKGDAGPMGPQGLQGEKGSIGQKGERGESVLSAIDTEKIKGEKGDPGSDGRPGRIGMTGPPGKCPESCKANAVQGPPGPPGPPGLSVTGPKGEPGGMLNEKTFYTFTDGSDKHGNLPDDEDDFYTAMTVVYKTVTALIKHTSHTPLGTLAYVIREKTLVLRVENGWQHVMMDYLIDATSETTTTFRPTTSRIEEEVPAKRSASDEAFIRLIALNEPYVGNMMSFNNRTGRTSANYACYRQARTNGIDGNFVAFLANKVEDLKNIVKNPREKALPIANLHGDILFKSWLDMFNGSGATLAKSANIYSFNRKNIFIDPTWPTKAVWHGGNLHGIRAPQTFCEEWQSNSRQHFGVASSLAHNKILGQDMYSCDNKLIVLCVEATATRRRQRHTLSRSRGHSRSGPRL